MEKYLTIKLRAGRTEEDVYRDTAIVAGYKDTITTTAEHTLEAGAELPEGAYDVQTFTLDADTTKTTYKLDTTVPHPLTDIEFGRAVVRQKFATQDAQLESDAVKLRAIAGYDE